MLLAPKIKMMIAPILEFRTNNLFVLKFFGTIQKPISNDCPHLHARSNIFNKFLKMQKNCIIFLRPPAKLGECAFGLRTMFP